MSISPVLVVHGGAGSLPSDEDRRAYLAGVRAALMAGVGELGRSAADAVTAAVVHLESHTITNAGRGAALARDGTAALDAGFMDGSTRRYGGVTGVRRTENPVLIARHLSNEGDFGRFVGPPCADGLVQAAGARLCEPDRLVTDRTRAMHAARIVAGASLPAPGASPWLDTVGAVALDAHGRLAAAVSTGGMSLKRPGRIGDSPVVGGGYWADDRTGAAVTTGVGEVLMRQGTARWAVRLLGQGRTPEQAAQEALDDLLESPDDQRGRSGLILVTPQGLVALDHNAQEMSAGWIRPDGSSQVGHQWCGPS